MKRPARLALLPALVLMFGATGCATPVATQSAGQSGGPSESQSTGQTPRQRCTQLISYFDRYGAGRSNNSDGRRNHTRLAAELDCSQGHFDRGIAEMEDLLRRKKFTPPPPGPNEPEDDA